jgi:hypothetical protein
VTLPLNLTGSGTLRSKIAPRWSNTGSRYR